MKKKGPPCIRGLKCFDKTGCPEKKWDGEEGCSAWVEMPYDKEDGTDTIIVKSCIDLINFDIQLKTLKLLAGNQEATESLRNGLCETVGKFDQPKSPPAMTQFMNMLVAMHNKNILKDK